MSNWVRYRFEHLRRWMDYALKVAKAARDVLGDVRVYVVGGVAEGRTTVLSDIDILIVAERFPEIRRGYTLRSWRGRSMPMNCLGTRR